MTCSSDLVHHPTMNIIQSFLWSSAGMYERAASILVISLAADRLCGAVCPGLQLAAFAKRERLPEYGLSPNGAFLTHWWTDIWGQQRPACSSSIYHPPARGNVVGGRELLSGTKSPLPERGRPQGAVLRKTFTHPASWRSVGMLMASAVSRCPAFWARTVKEPEQLQHGCFKMIP